MKTEIYKLESDNRCKNYLKYFLFGAGIILFSISFIVKNLEVLSFLGFLPIMLGLAITLFTTKQYLRIYTDQIEYESISIIKGFSKSMELRFSDINEVHFLKRQFLILGGRNPYAEADTQTL